jgi:hypothetical protein
VTWTANAPVFEPELRSAAVYARSLSGETYADVHFTGYLGKPNIAADLIKTFPRKIVLSVRGWLAPIYGLEPRWLTQPR